MSIFIANNFTNFQYILHRISTFDLLNTVDGQTWVQLQGMTSDPRRMKFKFKN